MPSVPPRLTAFTVTRRMLPVVAVPVAEDEAPEDWTAVVGRACEVLNCVGGGGDPAPGARNTRYASETTTRARTIPAIRSRPPPAACSSDK